MPWRQGGLAVAKRHPFIPAGALIGAALALVAVAPALAGPSPLVEALSFRSADVGYAVVRPGARAKATRRGTAGVGEDTAKSRRSGRARARCQVHTARRGPCRSHGGAEGHDGMSPSSQAHPRSHGGA